jgi:transcriptional regulator with XRE-family HTH domain
VTSLRIELGLALRQRRVVIGVSQERLGELSGLDRTYISGIERAVRNPTIDSLSRIAEALECELSELLAAAETARDTQPEKAKAKRKSGSGSAK